MLRILLLLLMICTCSCVFYGVLQFAYKNKIEMKKRVDRFVSISVQDKEKKESQKKQKSQLARILRENIHRFLSKKVTRQKQEVIKTLLIEAGNPFQITPLDFKMYQIILGTAFTLFMLLVFWPHTEKTAQVLLFSGAAGMFGYLYPLFYMKAKKKQRVLLIQKMMPDFFDMVNISIEAGLGLDGALTKVSKQMEGPLPEEFKRTLEEVRLGSSKKEAFRSLANRVPSDQFKSVINALIQADQMGIGMSKVLRAQTTRIREQRRQEIKEQAMKAPVKMLFPMILFIFPTLFIVLMGPIIVKLVTEWM